MMCDLATERRRRAAPACDTLRIDLRPRAGAAWTLGGQGALTGAGWSRGDGDRR